MSIQVLIILAAAVAVLMRFFIRSDERIEMPGGVHPGVGLAGTHPGMSVASSDPIEAALAAGRKIDAIKLYRHAHGVGLREAKEAVESMEPTLSPIGR